MDAYDNPNRTPSNQNDFNRVPNIPSKMANDNDKINYFSLTLLTYPKFRRNFKDVANVERVKISKSIISRNTYI